MSNTNDLQFLNIAMIGLDVTLDIGNQLIKAIGEGYAGFTLSYYDTRDELATRETIETYKLLSATVDGTTLLLVTEKPDGSVGYIAPTEAAYHIYFITGEPYLNDEKVINSRVTEMAKLLQTGSPFYIRDKGSIQEYNVIEIIGIRPPNGGTASVPAFRLIDIASGQYIIRCWDASFDLVDCLTPADEADIQMLLEELDGRE